MADLDGECVCHGNWRLIVKMYAPLLGRRFRRDVDGVEHSFYGIVHSDDDYYYGMYAEGRPPLLLSCVGNIESYGFTLIPPPSIRANEADEYEQ